MKKLPLIYCAIDTADLEHAKILAKSVGAITGGIKLGLEFFNRFGPQGIEQVLQVAPDTSLFIDLKFHDIPNTVAGAVRSICENLSPDYLNVHASGGLQMMRQAQEACGKNTRLLGVTVLTSLETSDLQEIGYAQPPQAQVLKMARLTQKAGLSGIVCSSHEIEGVRDACGENFVLMVPGIRPAGATQGDQKRIMTPKEALEAGATHLVIGRPITQAGDPAQAAQDIIASLA